MAEAEISETGSQESGSKSVEFEWGEETFTLNHFQNEENLPCVVKFEENEGGKLSPGLKIYSKQPVMFYTSVKRKTALARTIHRNPDGMYFEIGQTLLVPEDYEGWFELVPSDFSRASCFRSIAEVADAMPRKFFTRAHIKSLRISEDETGEQKYLERKISAGSVLVVDSIFIAKWKTSAQKGLLKKNIEWVTTEVKYLKCIDYDQKDILIPLTHRGKFNAIYEKGNLNQNSVYHMKDILSDLSLPVKIRLLYGKAPVVPCIFTGMMVVRELKQAENVIGSTVLNKRNVLFEIPISAPCSVKITSDKDVFTGMTSYKDAKKLCKKYARTYSTMIKLSPELDTNQKVIQHIPTDPSLLRKVDDALRTLDLITDISLTDEPRDQFMESDSDSIQSEDQIAMPRGSLLELTEYRSGDSHTHV